MHTLIIYCHPSKKSFTHQMKKAFIKGLEAKNHTYEISDLYADHFDSDYTENDYIRDALMDSTRMIPKDVLAEQDKIQRADALVFIYPIFWSEAPAKLVGWFQRVWTKGFAYGENCTMKKLEKALFLVSMGGDSSEQIHKEQCEAMKIVMLNDRINGRAKEKDMIFFTQTSREEKFLEGRKQRLQDYLEKVYHLGENL